MWIFDTADGLARYLPLGRSATLTGGQHVSHGRSSSQLVIMGDGPTCVEG